jgi:DNA-binding transcriptional ArsR family regulator
MIRPVHVPPLKARLFRSLGDEARLVTLEALIPGEQRVTDLVQSVGQPQSALSTHLATLQAAGLVVRRPAGREAWWGVAHPAVVTVLDSAEEVVVAATGESYACVSPCCSPAADASS